MSNLFVISDYMWIVNIHHKILINNLYPFNECNVIECGTGMEQAIVEI